MKVKFSELSCLSGYYGISVSTQFQRNRTIRFRNILHTLYPFFIYMLLSALSTSSPDVSVMVTSISLSVQRNTIHAAFIKSPYTHQNRSSFRNNYLFTKTLIYCFMEFLFWLYLLIVLSGDIEINPGPESVDLSSSCSSCTTNINLSLFEQNFSVVHYNVQSLLAKVDQLQMELSHFDVIALSETWLSPDIKDDKIFFQNYQKPFRKDRPDNTYGGVIIYVKNNIPCKRRTDLEVDGVESVWLEIRLKNKAVLLGTFYRAPNSSIDVHNKIESSIDLAFDTNIPNIIITGDFNYNYSNISSRRKATSLFDQYGLVQFIDEPTHFTETSDSIIDLLLARNISSVILSGVGDAFLDQNVRYHCPIYAVFNFDKCKQHCFKRTIWKYDDGNYDLLKQYVRDFDWSSLKNDNINTYAEDVTSKILELCKLTIPNKLITVRPLNPPWFNNEIRKIIRKRKRAHRHAKKVNTPTSWQKFRSLRNKSISAMRKSKQEFKDNLSNKITTGNFSSKDWWKTVKLLLGKDNNDDIPPLLLNGQPINDPNDKANAFNHYFHSQTQLDDSNVPVPELSQPDSILSSIELTIDEVESTLKSLAIGKACGPDQINNRILKELAVELSPPLTDLFNISLTQCTVPDIWKRANVSPVHKKDDKGSILGPLLFIMFINDIVKEIHSNIRLFADDTSLYIIVDFPDSAAQILNVDLERIYEWAVQWLVRFNPNKTESLLFSRKLNIQHHPTLFFNDVPIQEVVSHKHLGVYLSQSCDWHNHIDFIKEKAWSRMNLLRMLKFTIDRKSLETIYFTYIRSLLEYADIIWDNCSQQECNEIEKIQLEAGRIVTGSTKLVEINKLYKELGWLKLSERRDLHKLFLFYKMDHGLAPLYLSNLLPPHVEDVTSYRLRNAGNYVGIHANTRTYADSFLPSTIQAWNNLPDSIRSADTLATFKHLLTQDTPKVPKYYFCGDRFYQVLHTRLRTECSSLNQHLHKRNLVGNPYCLCGEVESNTHYLLTCPRYTHMRDEMVTSISQITNLTITTDVLLFGNDEVSDEVNTTIFEAVQKFIKTSKRFAN